MQDTPLTKKNAYRKSIKRTNSLTGGDLQHLGGQADGSLDTELLVLGTVDQVLRDCSRKTIS